MKNLFILILSMTALTMYSQEPSIRKGKNQTTILSKDKTIELAKIVLDAERMEDTIASLQEKLLQKDKIIEELSKSQDELSNEVLSLNKFIRELSKKEDEISDTQLKKMKFNWKGLHFRVFTEVPEFQFNMVYFGGRLNYELERFDLSLKGHTFIDNRFTYSVMIAYKIF